MSRSVKPPAPILITSLLSVIATIAPASGAERAAAGTERAAAGTERAAAGAQRADKPAMRSALPERVDAPRAERTTVRVRDTERTGTGADRGAAGAQRDTRERVNINTADVAALMTLPGVGRKLAEKIVAYRAAHGPFRKAGEIRSVDGFRGETWERNRQRIVVK